MPNVMAQIQPVMVVALLLTALVGLTFVAVFLRLYRVWLQAFLARAPVSIPVLIGMMFRRTPMKEIVRLRIMAVQAGVSISTTQIESAFLQGVDVERAVLAMIRAREIGMDLTWQDVISADSSERLKAKLYDE